MVSSAKLLTGRIVLKAVADLPPVLIDFGIWVNLYGDQLLCTAQHWLYLRNSFS